MSKTGSVCDEGDDNGVNPATFFDALTPSITTMMWPSFSRRSSDNNSASPLTDPKHCAPPPSSTYSCSVHITHQVSGAAMKTQPAAPANPNANPQFAASILQPWYSDDTTSEQVARFLMQSRQNGSFLVRDSCEAGVRAHKL